MRVYLLAGVTLVGLTTVLVSGYSLFQDWTALCHAHAAFEQLAARSASLNALFVAEARQNVHRLNCFAEGIGVLLGAILVAIGLHGLCLLPSRSTV
jgi:predicted transporter